MHLEAFLPAFTIFIVLGLVMPVLLSGIAMGDHSTKS